MKYLQDATKLWQTLSKREQMMILTGAIVSFILLFYWLIYRPYHNTVTALKQEVENQQQLVVWMQNTSQQIQQLKSQTHQTQGLGQKSLLVVVAETLKASNLQPSDLGQAANGKVNVKFNEVGFDPLVESLALLWQTYSIQASLATITRKDEPGIVEANLVLEMAN